MNEKRTVDDLGKMFSVTDAWFAKFGEVSPEAHKQLKRLLVETVKGARKVDYFLDTEARQVNVVLHLGFWTIMLTNTRKLAENVLELLRECLADYEINVSVQRFKKEETK